MSKKYWLLKSEPDCYSIDDLAQAPGQTDHWDGVRNYQARNMLRDDIKKGDEAFFYNSNTKVIGIAGIVEVARSGYPDHTAEDPNSQHPDPKHTASNPIWYMVDVKFKRKFAEVLPMSDLRGVPGLEGMMLLQRGSRLSVQPVTAAEWKIILGMAKKKGL